MDKPLQPSQTATQLLNRSLSSPELRDFLKQNLGHDLPDWPLKNWDFETLNWAAFYYNPSLSIAREQWAMAHGGIITAGERPNPTLTAGPGYDFNPAAGTISPWLPAVTLDVPVETAGKRAKRMEQMTWLAESARLNVFTAAWQVRSDLRQALIEWDAAGRRATVARNQVALARHILDLLQQRLDAGAIAADEMSATRIIWVKAQSDAGAAERALGMARARIAEVIGVPSSAIDGVEFSVAQLTQGKTFTPADIAAARATSLQMRADVLAAMAIYEASQSALKLEIAKQYPDIHLGSGYQYDLGENKWSLSIGVDLPVFNHNEGPIAEAAAAREQAAGQVLAVQAHIIAQIDAAAAAYAAATGLVEDMGKVNTELQKHLDLINAQIAAGATDELDRMNAQLDAEVSQQALVDAQLQVATARGQLEDAFQIPLANLSAVQIDPLQATSSSTKP
ncbi:MAG TPA: TolC family protein [Opitutales bacterium]|nr:TolC family protein [Opitutales bacterium]